MISFIEESKLDSFVCTFARQKTWKLQPLKGGLLNQNYILAIGTKNYVLKVYRPEMTESKVKEMFSVMKFAADHSLPVVCSLDETIIDGHTVAIYPFVEGVHPSRYRNTHARIRSMGAMLGKIHTTLDSYKPITPAPTWDKISKFLEPNRSIEQIGDLRGQLSGHLPAVKRELTAVLDTYENVIDSQTWDIGAFAKLPIRFIHGDYHMQNVLMKGNMIVTILDWEKSEWHFRDFEIMRSIIHNCHKTAGELDWSLIEEYLQGYRQYATVSRAEAELAFECGYRPIVFSFWTIKQYLAGHNNFRQSIIRRKKILQLLTKHRVEYAERIKDLLL